MALAAASNAVLQHAAFAAGPAPRRQRGAARRLQVAAQASSSSTSVSGVPDKTKPDWTGEPEMQGGCLEHGATEDRRLLPPPPMNDLPQRALPAGHV